MPATTNQMVMSQTWVKDADHAAAYIAEAASFDDWLRARPGFVSRVLVQGVDDPCHLLHLRTFRSVADYEALIDDPEYQRHIQDLSRHVDPSRYPDGAVPKEYGDVVWETPIS